MYVTETFTLPDEIKRQARTINPMFGFNGFSEYLFMKHYSRVKYLDGVPYGQEDWWDACIRVIEGTFSIRKTHYAKNNLYWMERSMMDLAEQMLYALVRMQWLMGRGLWAMGTKQVATRGGMALYNCAACNLGTYWDSALCWAMDASMHGVGVGFNIEECGLKLKEPTGAKTFIVEDTREGWVASLATLIEAFKIGGNIPELVTSKVRPKGSPIRTFGGVASGPEPLIQMHTWATDRLYEYCAGYINEMTLKADIANMLGVCVVAGNVRRSAEILTSDFSYDDGSQNLDFLALKKDDNRRAWSWMSNNSVRLWRDDDFENLPQIAQLCTDGGDVGYLNMQSFPYPRLGRGEDGMRMDMATLVNPCGETPLEDREVCNLAETCPTRCATISEWLQACEYATFYTQTVSLLPTHSAVTNAVIARNRRIGVSIMDFANWKQMEGTSFVTKALRDGYDRVRNTGIRLAAEAGVPAPIRNTVVKPGGTLPKLAACGSGASNPTFPYILRRVRVGYHEPMYAVLHAAGVMEEADSYDQSCACFCFPIDMSNVVPATHVSIWEQAMNVVLLQREWADNAVSNTLYYKPRWECVGRGNINFKEDWSYPQEVAWLTLGLEEMYAMSPKIDVYTREFDNHLYQIRFDRETDDWKVFKENPNHEENQLEAVLAAIAPHTKSVSLLPHSSKGLFKQMPEEELTQAEYQRLCSIQPKLNWKDYICESDEIKYCEGDRCTVK